MTARFVTQKILARRLSVFTLGAALTGLSLVQSLSAQAQVLSPNPTLTTLHTLDNTYGSHPTDALVQGADGSLYGVTLGGGLPDGNQGYGTIFRINPATHQFTTLIKFNGTNGAYPNGIMLASDGSFYITTAGGGNPSNDGGYGTVQRFTPDGQLSTVFKFSGTNGASPYHLLQAADGNFYSTAGGGNADGTGRGVIFKLTPAGVLTVLYKFDKTHGSYPSGGLVQGSDGSFYGTTVQGGTLAHGVVFRLRPNGSYAVLHTFDNTNGANPIAALVQGADGSFYGSTYSGDETARGILFKITSNGTFTTLHKFSNDEHGIAPYAPLLLSSDGNFYGSTVSGGTADTQSGTLFRMTPSGQVTTLYKFGIPAHGSIPQAGLIQASDGAFYGTNYQGGIANGAAGYGTIFKLTLP